MADESLQDLLARLDREREGASRLYNDALTAVDQALQRRPSLPPPPPEYDDRQIHTINQHWDILPAGPPAADSSLKGRLRGFIWRLVGPAFEQQKGFNAAVVDHLNRNVAAHRESARATASLIALVGEQVEGLVAFQHRLVQYLQTITLYVDTKDRATAGQAQVLNAAIAAMTDDWLKRWESLTAREQRFTARVASLEDLRQSVALAQQTSLTLKREVERLLEGRLAAVGGRQTADALEQTAPSAVHGPQAAIDLDSFKYVGFEDAFRGSTDDIRGRLEQYVRLFAGQSDVLDVGCGRGEFLDLLRAHGIRARGLDLNHEMVEVSRARGLDVTEADVLGYLQGLDDGSLGGLFAAQVVEHLDPSYLMRFIETAGHKIRSGGLIVLETINPACWAAFFDSYIRDLTHVRPLHPETLQYLVRVSGFQQVAIQFTSPIPESARLQPVAMPPADQSASLGSLAETFNENVAKLNARMFTYQDYAIVGRKQA
jgi:SAM-dependent methyltransferase